MARIVIFVVTILFGSSIDALLFKVPMRPKLLSQSNSCSNTPTVEGATGEMKVKGIQDDAGRTSMVFRVTFTCNNGMKIIGNPVATCRRDSGRTDDGTWSPLPTCPVSSPKDYYASSYEMDEPSFSELADMIERQRSRFVEALEPGFVPKSLQSSGSSNDVSPCESRVAVDPTSYDCQMSKPGYYWRYEGRPNYDCQQVYGCMGSNPNQNAFKSLESCTNACLLPQLQPKASSDKVYFEDMPVVQPEAPRLQAQQTTTTTTTTTPAPTAKSQNGAMTGGGSGSECITGARPPHTSCLSDGSLLKKTNAFPISEALDAHNKIRKMFQSKAKSMPLLKWDKDLAITAERWAAQCPDGHDSYDARKTSIYDIVGQNICWSSGVEWSWEECVTAWYDEIADWEYGVGQTKPNAVVGHLTQLIWAKTIYVGCGRASCGGQWENVMICNYGPGGNYANWGEDPYKYPYEKA